MTQNTTVRMRHLRAVGICSRGARKWWADHGFDWNEFLESGIDAERLRQIGGAYVDRVTERAEREDG